MSIVLTSYYSSPSIIETSLIRTRFHEKKCSKLNSIDYIKLFYKLKTYKFIKKIKIIKHTIIFGEKNLNLIEKIRYFLLFLAVDS